MRFTKRPKTRDQHQLTGKEKLGRTQPVTAVCRLFGRFHHSCHSERSRGIWPRRDDAPHPAPDVSTPLRFARHDNGCLAAFTLIELLVVISIIALLMAILMPTLSRVRKQGHAVVCQSKLRQWGLLFNTAVIANEGEAVFPFVSEYTEADRDWRGFCFWPQCERRYGPQIRDLFLCPMASRPDRAYPEYQREDGWRGSFGGTFSAYWASGPDGQAAVASYGFSPFVAALGMGKPPDWRSHLWPNIWPYTDTTVAPASVPLMYDSSYWGLYARDEWGPPPYESLHLAPVVALPQLHQCINRHEGAVNYLFMDWSVRKVGLKELWTLKWHGDFDIQGPWTRAGGVAPEDWPPWMRRFKDH